MTSQPVAPSTPSGGPQLDPATESQSANEKIRSAREMFESGDYVEALRTLNWLPKELREGGHVSKLARDCYLKMGQVSRALGEVNRARGHVNDPSFDRQARFLFGRLRESDPTWLPKTPTSQVPIYRRSGKVLHLLKESLPYVESGYTLRSRMTLAAQRQAGLEAVVVTSLGFPRYNGVESVPPSEVVDGVIHHRLDSTSAVTGTDRVPFDILLDEQAVLTAAIADDEKPAVIQAGSGFRGYDQALVGLAVATRADLPLVYEVRGFFESTWTNDRRWAEHGEYHQRRRRQDLRCIDAAARVITIAEVMRDEMVRRGVDPEKISVIPNVVDAERFTPRSKSQALMSSLGLVERPVVGYISNLGPREGVEYLIRATEILRQRGSEVTCLIVGDGPQRERLRELVDELDLAYNVILTGHIQNHLIEDYYALMDVFVVPRVDDRQARLVTPLKPLEAMAMGIPIVISDLPALRELASPGVRGMVAKPASAESLADTLHTMLEDPNLRSTFADRARRWVMEDRDLTSNVERYRRALDGLA